MTRVHTRAAAQQGVPIHDLRGSAGKSEAHELGPPHSSSSIATALRHPRPTAVLSSQQTPTQEGADGSSAVSAAPAWTQVSRPTLPISWPCTRLPYQCRPLLLAAFLSSGMLAPLVCNICQPVHVTASWFSTSADCSTPRLSLRPRVTAP